jgi:hypothetical protein
MRHTKHKSTHAHNTHIQALSPAPLSSREQAAKEIHDLNLVAQRTYGSSSTLQKSGQGQEFGSPGYSAAGTAGEPGFPRSPALYGPGPSSGYPVKSDQVPYTGSDRKTYPDIYGSDRRSGAGTYTGEPGARNQPGGGGDGVDGHADDDRRRIDLIAERLERMRQRLPRG